LGSIFHSSLLFYGLGMSDRVMGGRGDSVGEAQGSMTLQKLKRAVLGIDRVFLTDRIDVSDVVMAGDAAKPLREKIEKAQKSEQAVDRIRRCRTASQVFLEFSIDAAAAKIDEMLHGKTSDSRQRAQETVLEYALGKPVNRILSISGKIADAADDELEHDIRRLLAELGFAKGEGATSRLLVGTQDGTGRFEVASLSTESGISAEVHSESQEG
jgi:hypothetical protein